MKIASAAVLAPAILWCSLAATVAAQTVDAGNDSEPAPQQGPSRPGTGSMPIDSRTQYPSLLANSYFGFDLGTINYSFSNRQLESGVRVESVDVPHPAARVILFGHQFHKYLSAQVGYTRPVKWVVYNHLNGTDASHTVWMAVGDVSLKSQVPVAGRLALYGEAGLGVVNRIGFDVDGGPGVSHANFATPLFGAGVEYSVNPRWDLVAGASYVPEHEEKKQPAIALGTLGFRYLMRPLPDQRVEQARDSGNIFPANLVQLAFVTNAFGYAWNDVVSSKTPIFWGGHIQIARGATLRYQRNLFHSESRIALDVGASVSVLKTDTAGENVVAVAAYPLLRWTFLRTATADVFMSYSIAGPSYLSKRMIDGEDIGNRFSFQDIFGFGMFINKRRNTFIQFDISHYSNGNFFSSNPGVRIPTTIAIGRGF